MASDKRWSTSAGWAASSLAAFHPHMILAEARSLLPRRVSRRPSNVTTGVIAGPRCAVGSIGLLLKGSKPAAVAADAPRFPVWTVVYQQAQRWFLAGVFEEVAHDLPIISGS